MPQDINKSVPKKIAPALLFAAFSLVISALLQLFRLELLETLIFFVFFLELFAVGFLFFSLLLSIKYIYKNRRAIRLQVFIPLLINFITIFIVLFTPLSDIVLEADFSLNKNAREKVVSLIESGDLKPNVEHNEKLIHLPSEYRNLSKGGGDIKIANTQEGVAVFFFMFRGILDNYSGFAYCPSENIDCTKEFVNENDILQVVRKNNNWYWLASN